MDTPLCYILGNKERPTMIPEFALEKFPMDATLRDGTRCTVRPLSKRDAARLQKFFFTVPEEERLFVKQSILDGQVFHHWCKQLDFDENLPLLIFHGPKIIGCATLHQRRGGWKRHIGVVTLLTHPDFRGRDITKILVTELIELARYFGLSKLEVELTGERKIAIGGFAQLGFRQYLRIPDYVLDMKAVTHDYVLMGRGLKVDEEYAGIGG
jgi:GNAT superfamily N-acetyltransferase